MTRRAGIALLSALLALCACAKLTPPDAHVPPFARVPYEPPSRTSIVAIALREWNLFGRPVEDPAQPPPAGPKPEREPGFWQRVGEYWWVGMNPGAPQAGWTGMHEASGQVFPPSDDAEYAWSAAFISYVMRIAGFGPHFPYAPNHATYINIAAEMTSGRTSGWLIRAERPEAYAPLPGDLICMGRAGASDLTFDDLPAGRFPAHCAIVVSMPQEGQIDVIGGNVNDAVSLTHVPVDAEGKLAAPGGVALDPYHHWMVVIRVLVDTPVALGLPPGQSPRLPS